MNHLNFIFLFLIVFGYGQKSANQVAEKFKPNNSTIVHKVIQQTIWGHKDAVIVFYESHYIDSISTTEHRERQYVDAYLLIPTKTNYKKILINRFEDDNVDTEIQSVFFANADQDLEKELIIMSTVTHRLQYLYDGTEYSTTVLDNFKPNVIPLQLKILDEISQKLSGGFEGYLDGEGQKISTIKTAEDVKKKLENFKIRTK